MIGVPKPRWRLTDDEKLLVQLERIRHARARRKPLKRTPFACAGKPLVRTTPLRAVNPERRAKRLATYRKVLASNFHKRLRYDAWQRAGGLCECDPCVNWRADPRGSARLRRLNPPAFRPIPVWFTKKGGEPWRRFRSTAGEIHHESYALFGDENPGELRLVRWMWKEHHAAIERQYGTRRRYLKEARRG